jgi:tripartite-type tricarboxylate transporter receptor subunit TctC
MSVVGATRKFLLMILSAVVKIKNLKRNWTKYAIAVAAAGPAAVFAAMTAAGANAQFPSRPVRIIVPTAPGGGADFLARLVAQRLTDVWRMTVVVDNRSGAASLIGVEMGAHALPDGYTLVIVNPSYMLTAEHSGKLSFARGGDFVPVAMGAETAMLLAAYPGIPAKSLKELIEIARSKPRSVNYASGGVGTATHLLTELLAKKAGVQMVHVPYKGGGAMVPALIGGEVQICLVSAATVIPHVQTGRLRGLAVTGVKRLPNLPELPTFAEAGYPSYAVSVWYGLFGPRGITPAIVANLNADINSVLQQPEAVEKLVVAGFEPSKPLSGKQFADYVASELVIWKEAQKAAMQ